MTIDSEVHRKLMLAQLVPGRMGPKTTVVWQIQTAS